MSKHNIGDKVRVGKDEFLGNDEYDAVIVEVHNGGYVVKDEDGWTGPVDLNLIPMPSIPGISNFKKEG